MRGRSRDVMKAVKRTAQKLDLARNPNTPYGIAVAVRSRQPGKRGGYLNTLNRQQKKVRGQMKGVPGCGPRIYDWGVPYVE